MSYDHIGLTIIVTIAITIAIVIFITLFLFIVFICIINVHALFFVAKVRVALFTLLVLFFDYFLFGFRLLLFIVDLELHSQVLIIRGTERKEA